MITLARGLVSNTAAMHLAEGNSKHASSTSIKGDDEGGGQEERVRRNEATYASSPRRLSPLSYIQS